MKAVVQRVSQASVTVDGAVIGEIGQGVLILVCAMSGDVPAKAEQLALKISKLRIFKDNAGKMNLSLKDIGGSALIVSQFTLAGDTSRGNRPGFSNAAPPDVAEQLYETFKSAMKDLDIPVQSGRFGADMAVDLRNDGPVTILYDV
ncbi:MAG: D-aminoacyl-tRNA deacylase [Planktotalea sp.]|jgi:D-tyrosyl-tRNA(Tyr) deacylase|uniref:D-aminoacyl-tRNA deacylase n=1 Tax=Planktotalea sp. TaxID=2029877 RepID=UPI0001838AED|nr:D-aminoacyl-tRNA deacylase [Planktotalea sp.]EDZ40646.1 D-tyrosyl-tRNA(Tyr) deacylase [Rhodobacteraceae bacterium HTCC2083]MBT5823347.1 D-tyrosyl-tRNA(Tyr) deacylase [Paracoccaceae bacterium]MDG1077444.1 D-aminoacyl-tRNA deacylase [Planktotalea sp.]MDG1084322.1 D-aminoacyl-tRNA deacylase [Planktotalea sp.]HCW85142.1 D-tyrosyl-tRNA(Tyr) deacylase [Paracoccaceae bacterium]